VSEMFGRVSCSGPSCDDPENPGQVCTATIAEALERWIITREGYWCDQSCLDSWESSMRTRYTYIDIEEGMPVLQPGEWRSDPDLDHFFGPLSELRTVQKTTCFRDEQPSGPTGDPDFNRIIERMEEAGQPPECSWCERHHANAHRLLVCDCLYCLHVGEEPDDA
jgi:hypothetical protein